MPGPDDMTAEVARRMWRDDAASRGLGMSLVTVSPGAATITMPVTAAMLNGHGTCHGGFIFALADSAFAFACNSLGARAVAQSCTITYLAPVAAGAVLSAEATDVARAGRTTLTDVRVTLADGTLVALFRGQSRNVPGSWADVTAGTGAGEG